jgi:protein disulfide-isomerase A6
MFKGLVNLGAIDASADGPLKRVASDYGISGFPTMKLFRDEKVEDVNTRDPNEIIKIIMEAFSNTVQERNNAANDNESSGGSSSSSRSGKTKNSTVLSLNSSNFQQHVYDNPNVVAVAFIAPWCGHCKSLVPEWEIAASKLIKNGATLATVDATVEEALAAQFQVQGFPTIKLFPGGTKKSGPSDAMDYQGGRESAEIVQSIMAEVDRTGVAKEIPELISQDLLEETCSGEGQNVICVLVSLPHILETGAEGRNTYKDIVTAASKAVRGMAFEFMWFEGGNYQTQLEESMELTFGFPAIAAYSMDKGVYAVHRASFTEQNIRKFLTGITTGKLPTYKVRDMPKVVTVDPWDGKDGVPFEEEPFEWDDDDDVESDGNGDGDEL